MTSATGILALLTLAVPAAAAALLLGPLPPRAADAANRVLACATAGAALALAAVALLHAGSPHRDAAFVVDVASGVFVGVIAVVGLLSALLSPAYLAGGGQGFSGRAGRTPGTTSASTCSGPCCWPCRSSATWA